MEMKQAHIPPLHSERSHLKVETAPLKCIKPKFIIKMEGLLGLHLHQHSAKLRDTELLCVLQALLLIEVLPQNRSECD